MRLKRMWMWRVRDGTVAFHNTSENNLSNCNFILFWYWAAIFLKCITLYIQHIKWQARLRKRLSINQCSKKQDVYTNTDTVSNTLIWHAVCCITERERGELTFYRKGKNGRTQKRKRAKKKEACLQSYIRANRKNRGDSKVNESLGNLF